MRPLNEDWELRGVEVVKANQSASEIDSLAHVGLRSSAGKPAVMLVARAGDSSRGEDDNQIQQHHNSLFLHSTAAADTRSGVEKDKVASNLEGEDNKIQTKKQNKKGHSFRVEIYMIYMDM